MMNGCTVNRSYRDDYPVSFWTFDPSSLIFFVQVLQPAFSYLSTTNIFYGYRIHVNYLDYITVSLGMIFFLLVGAPVSYFCGICWVSRPRRDEAEVWTRR